MPIRPPRNLNRKQRKGWLKNGGLWIWLIFILCIPLFSAVLWKSGRWLVAADDFEKVPWALVLAGESRDCERSDAAIKLYQEGRVDTVVLSACRIFKTHYHSEYVIDYLAEQGIPRGKIFEFRQDAYSTIEEARALVRQFRFQNLDTVLIITSNYHSARTRRIFRKLAGGYPQILVYPAEFATYNPDAWWANRESLKYWLNEWIKTFETYVELLNSGAENGKADFQNLLPDIWTKHSEDSAHGLKSLMLQAPLADSLLKVSPALTPDFLVLGLTDSVTNAAKPIRAASDTVPQNSKVSPDSVSKVVKVKTSNTKAVEAKPSDLTAGELKKLKSKPKKVVEKSKKKGT